MATNERLNDFADIDAAAKQFDYLEKRLEAYVKSMDTASKAAKLHFDGLNGAKGLGDMNSSAAGVSQANKEMLNFKQVVTETNGFLKQYSGTLSANLTQYIQYKQRLSEVKKELTDLKKLEGDHAGTIRKLTEEEFKLNAALAETRVSVKAETKERIAAAGSIDDMRLRLGRLRDTYRQLSEVDRNSDTGKKVLGNIQELDAAVKKANGSIGNFQDNVGNYPNALAELKAIREEMVKLALAGKQDTLEFKEMTQQAQHLGMAINSVGALTPLSSSTVVTTSQHLSQVNSQLHQMAVEGKQDTAEFKHLVAEAQKLKAAIDGVNQQVKDTGEQVSGSFKETVVGAFKNIGAAIAAYFSFDAIKNFFSDSLGEISQADEAAGRLQNTLESFNNMQAFGRFADQADEVAEKLKYLDNDDVTEVFNKLLTYGKLTEKQMSDLLPVIVDFAAKEKVSVTDSAETIIKALEGSGKALKTYGIDIKDATDASETAASPTERLSLIMKELKPRVEGAAAAFGATLPGKLAILQQGIKDTEESFGRFLEQISGVEQASLNTAIANKKEADTAQALVKEYEQLTAKVNKTSEDKKRLADITHQLGGIFGNSVLSINAETGALQLNVQATKDLITQKLLLADQEASKAAQKYNKAERDRQAAYDNDLLTQQLYEQAAQTLAKEEKLLKASQSGKVFSGMSQAKYARAEEYRAALQDFQTLELQLKTGRDRINASIEARNKALKSLKDLGYSEDDINKLFNPDKPITPKAGGDASKEKDQTSAKLAAYKELLNAKYQLAKQDLDIDSQNQKAIMDSTQYSLDYRLEAYHKYYQNQEKLAEMARDKDILEEQAKVKDLTAELTKKKGDERKAIEDQIEASQIRIETISKQHLGNLAGLQHQADNDVMSIIKSGEVVRDQELSAWHNFYKALLKAKEEHDKKELENKAKVQGVKDQLNQLEWQAVQQGIETTKSLLDGYYDKELKHLDDKYNLIQRNKEAEIAAINDAAGNDEEKKARIAAITAQYAAQEKQIEHEKAAINRKKAIADRVAANASILQETAVAEVAALKLLADPITAPLYPFIAALIGGIGLAKGIAVNAAPLPEYADGTEDHPGGLARVGEAGPEAIIEPGKAPYLVDSDRIMNLPKHTRVIPEHDFVASGLGFMTGSLLRTIEAGNNINMNMSVDNSRLEAVTKSGLSEVKQAIQNMPQTQFIATGGEFQKVVRKRGEATTFINKHTA